MDYKKCVADYDTYLIEYDKIIVRGKENGIMVPPPMTQLQMLVCKNLSLEDMPGEEWKPLIGAESFYHISNYGRIKRLPRMVGRESYPRPVAIQKQCDHMGYLCATITYDSGIQNKESLHRLMGINFLENIHDLPEVNHINGIRWDDRLENLEWSTSKGNSSHAHKMGLQVSVKGRSNNRRKRTKLPPIILTEEELASEMWVDVKGYEGIYMVSDLGRVQSLDKLVNLTLRDGSPSKRLVKGQMLKGNAKKDGYVYVSLYDNNAFQTDISIQRVVALNFLPNTYNKPEVNHKNFITNDNRLVNLEWSTELENIQHAIRGNRMYIRKGEEASSSTLKALQVLEIRAQHATGKFSKLKLARMYNVGQSTIRQIVNRQTWKHLKNEQEEKQTASAA